MPGAQLLPDRKVFTLGQFFTFLGYLGQFYGPLQFMSRVADFLSRSLASAERVFEVLDTESDVQDAENPTPLPRIEGRVEFKNVTFGYEPHKPVLKDVSFAVAPGEMIGLVGQSGAGKSTTINLICRFYEAQEGEVTVDGVNIKQVAQNDLRSQIGVVLQEPFLFSGSIYENIAFARPNATREDVMAAAKAANAHDFIIQKPDGYDTQVGERGQTLSGGERQRVSIARAILHNPRILILDEATASVDTDTEKQIQDAIARLIKGRTTFAIAHRLSTLRLTVEEDRSYLKVSVLRAFPLSEPNRFLSVRDSANKEIGLIANPADLGAENRKLVEEELERRYLVPAVTRIIAAKERFGTVDWTIETDRGICRFTTRNLRENVQRPAPGRIILNDVDGNRYDIRNVGDLSRESQELLFRHM